MKSICLRAHEVLGLLAGTVSLIVRPMRHQPSGSWARGPMWVDTDGFFHAGVGKSLLATRSDLRSPFGAPGERLACKETWRPYLVVGNIDHCGDQGILYQADGGKRSDCRAGPLWSMDKAIRWRSPATMPRWACRLIIETVDVRAGLVKEIAGRDAVAAGVKPCEECGHDDCIYGVSGQEYKCAFEVYWRKRYGKRHPWATAFAWFARVKTVEAEG